jgi:hypothetical protein
MHVHSVLLIDDLFFGIRLPLKILMLISAMACLLLMEREHQYVLLVLN